LPTFCQPAKPYRTRHLATSRRRSILDFRLPIDTRIGSLKMFTHPINNPQHWRLANILATHAILFPSNAPFFKFQAAY